MKVFKLKSNLYGIIYVLGKNFEEAKQNALYGEWLKEDKNLLSLFKKDLTIKESDLK